jgi:hypothetical protein
MCVSSRTRSVTTPSASGGSGGVSPTSTRRSSSLRQPGATALAGCGAAYVAYASGDIPEHSPKREQLGSCIESEHDLGRLLVAPMGELAPFAHDEKTALRQHTDRPGVVARSASVKRTGCLQLQELL